MNSQKIHTGYKLALRIALFSILWIVFDFNAKNGDIEKHLKFEEFKKYGIKTVCRFEYFETTFQGNIKKSFVTNTGDTITKISKMSIDGYIRNYPNVEDTIIYLPKNPENFYTLKEFNQSLNYSKQGVTISGEIFYILFVSFFAFIFSHILYHILLFAFDHLSDVRKLR